MIEALKERKLMKKLAAINRETVPERAMFAKGAGARGFFQPYMTMSDYTAADFLLDPEKRTPVFVRFSKASQGEGETGRDVRGFAVRFYTETGNYDLLTCSMPVFYTNDPMKIPQLIQSLKKEKQSNLRRPERFFRFAVDNPEVINLLLRLYSDGGTIKSYRYMPGYSVNTYRWVNGRGESFLARCSFLPLAGVRCISRQEAEFLAGFDEETASRDLYETLREGSVVEYELTVQLVPESKAEEYTFDLTDPVQMWPLRVIPAVRVGKLVLTDTVNDYLNDVEKAAFTPGNVVRGIEFSRDPLLPVMAFAMEDGHRHRLGADYESLPVNRMDLYSQGEAADLETDDWQASINGAEGSGSRGGIRTKNRRNAAEEAFRQAQLYYQGLSPNEKQVLADNLAEDLMFLPEPLQKEMSRRLQLVDPELGKQIAKEIAF